jgi:hypothetical protein
MQTRNSGKTEEEAASAGRGLVTARVDEGLQETLDNGIRLLEDGRAF